MEGLGNSSFVDFIEENISTKPANWFEKKKDRRNLGSIKGATLVEVDLRNANLAYTNLSGITFGNWVNFDGANLKGTDFTRSHIVNARGLTCEQIQQAIIDKETQLPNYLGSCGQ